MSIRGDQWDWQTGQQKYFMDLKDKERLACHLSFDCRLVSTEIGARTTSLHLIEIGRCLRFTERKPRDGGTPISQAYRLGVSVLPGCLAVNRVFFGETWKVNIEVSNTIRKALGNGLVEPSV
jgi:hypothetical protein